MTARSDGEDDPEKAFIGYLLALYARQPPDLIITIGGPAARFIQQRRPQLFPATPVVMTAVEDRRVNHSGLTENDAVVAVRNDFALFFDSLLQVKPDVREIAVVIGASPLEQFWLEEIRKEAQSFQDRVRFVWYNELGFEEILRRVSVLPPHSAIFWQLMSVDATGVAHEGNAAFARLHQVANAPIFSYQEAFFGQGNVGGPMHSIAQGSKQAVEVALRILGGERAGDVKTAPIGFASPKYDWREARRWGLAENRLPQGSELYFREPSAWERYRWQLLFVTAVILVQAALISGLLFEHRKRRLAEAQVRQRFAELARSNRYSLAGELAATISHEINQPLGAILTNIETLEAMLQAPAPDVPELRKIAADIRHDDQRAADVIRHLRNLLKRSSVELSDIDLNEPVQNAVQFFQALPVARNATIVTSLAPVPLPVKGNVVQLHQTVLIIIVNAMDAMSSLPADKRKLDIATLRAENSAEVLISDTGPGIPPDKLKEIFAPFFTTKEEGMGMGLSIARTIIESHGGQIWAENRPGGGAVFRIRLPVVRQ